MKYRIDTGKRAFPVDSIPHSKFSSFFFELILGVKRWVANRVKTTKLNATPIWMSKGRYDILEELAFIYLNLFN
jgi:hypothetical protein